MGGRSAKEAMNETSDRGDEVNEPVMPRPLGPGSWFTSYTTELRFARRRHVS